MKKLTTEEFIEKSKLIHGNKYDYNSVRYINAITKIPIICKEHGSFWQTPNKHLMGRGCNKCKGGVKLEQYDVMFRIKEIFPEYELNECEYINSKSKLKIICPIHGAFYKTVSHILNRKNVTGCQKCRRKFQNKEEFMKEVNFRKELYLLNNINIDYSEMEYTSMRTKTKFICKKHGEFWQTPSNHLMGKNCSKCSHKISKPEIELQNFIKDLGYKIITNSKKIIKPYELDIYIPKLKKAIEFNGEYWHYSDKNPNSKPKGYHAMKSNLCKDMNIKLLHIREDLWRKNQHKMEQIILKFLTKN